MAAALAGRFGSTVEPGARDEKGAVSGAAVRVGVGTVSSASRHTHQRSFSDPTAADRPAPDARESVEREGGCRRRLDQENSVITGAYRTPTRVPVSTTPTPSALWRRSRPASISVGRWSTCAPQSSTPRSLGVFRRHRAALLCHPRSRTPTSVDVQRRSGSGNLRNRP
jgi:hypothetical protein